MKYYLSSYRLGDEENQEKFKQMTLSTNKKVAYIPNALDFATDLEKKKNSESRDIADLESIGLIPQKLDLQEYFNRREDLQKVLGTFDILFVRGGNTFVLREAMSRSGFDSILEEMITSNRNMIYAGYSAGICVLQQDFENLYLADDPTQRPYGTDQEAITTGLGIIDYYLAPHYQSDHFESEVIGREVELMKKKNMNFKALRDGEVIIIE